MFNKKQKPQIDETEKRNQIYSCLEPFILICLIAFIILLVAVGGSL